MWVGDDEGGGCGASNDTDQSAFVRPWARVASGVGYSEERHWLKY